MNQIDMRTATQADVQPLTNKVLRNAYLLLALMLALSAAVTTWTISAQVAPLNIWLALGLLIGTPMLAMTMARTAFGVPAALGYGAVLGYVFGIGRQVDVMETPVRHPELGEELERGIDLGFGFR